MAAALLLALAGLGARAHAVSAVAVALVALAGLALAADLALALAPQRRGLFARLGDPGRGGDVALLAIAGALLALYVAAFRGYVVDDAFITFRYARNWITTGQIVWNPGEPPIEGYSNFLWMALSALAQRAGLDPLAAARVLAFASLLASGLLAGRLAAAAGAGPLGRRLATLFVLAAPPFTLWAMSGLETLSVVALLLAFLLALERDLARAGAPWRSALLAGLLVLSRPETPLFLALALAPAMFGREPRARAQAWRVGVGTALLVAPYVAWKVLTFHALVPNTLTAKWHPLAGAAIVGAALTYAAPFALLAILSPARLAGTAQRRAWLVFAGAAAAFLQSSPLVAHEYRFFLPALAGVFALGGLDAERLLLARGPRAGAATTGLVLVLVALLAGSLPETHDYAARESAGLSRAHVRIGRLLARTFGGRGTLAASDCGALPWYSGMRTIDLWGLNDRQIAQAGFDPAYVLAQHPDVVVLNSLAGGRFVPRSPYDGRLAAEMRREPALALRGRWNFLFYWVWVYARVPLAGGDAGDPVPAAE